MNTPTSNTIMKYFTLLLFLFVILYGINIQSKNPKILSVTSITKKELPIYCVNSEKPVLALTFDSAWGTEDLSEILQILKKHNAPATFFVTGEFAKKNPDAIKSMQNAGHEIANHGNSHKHMPQIQKEEQIKEIMDCHNLVKEITGTDMKLFRAPYSDWNDLVVETAHELGYMSINHSVDSLDWKDYGVASIVETVCNHKNLENGSIILLHNGTKHTKNALDSLLKELEKKGYSFILTSDLIYYDSYYFDHTGKQFQIKK